MEYKASDDSRFHLAKLRAESPRGLNAGKSGGKDVEHPRACMSDFPAALLAKTGFFGKNIIVHDIYIYISLSLW